MALDIMIAVDTIAVMENYISKVRPSKDIRDKVDINYRTENQSIILFEIRPIWNDKSRYLHHDYAKTTFSKTKNRWKVYWRRSDLKWHLYKPKPEVERLSDFLHEIEQDPFGCFKS